MTTLLLTAKRMEWEGNSSIVAIFIYLPLGSHKVPLLVYVTTLVLQLGLNNSICPLLWGWPEFDDPETCLVEQRFPLFLSPLHTGIESHHGHIEHGKKGGRALLGDNHLVEKQLRIPGLHCLLQLL
jgi:hypothetical protein